MGMVSDIERMRKAIAIKLMMYDIGDYKKKVDEFIATTDAKIGELVEHVEKYDDGDAIFQEMAKVEFEKNRQYYIDKITAGIYDL